MTDLVPPPVSERAASLASRLPEQLEPLARLAANYGWSWTPGARDLFQSVDRDRFAASEENPVQLLREADPATLAAAAEDPGLVASAWELADELAASLAAPHADRGIDPDRPVAFFCAEFAIHRSLPVYAGGLGVLAGDLVKQASDLRLPFVGVGLLYRRGYFEQSLDPSGLQVERWPELDPAELALTSVTARPGEELVVSVPIDGRAVSLQVWRADVGRVPLFLLDADRPENAPEDRSITSRLYEADRTLRLKQYVALGLGGMRALAAVGVHPGVVHMNEGHAAFAALEMPPDTRMVLTTHTPVAAGNESYDRDEVERVLGDAIDGLGLDRDEVLDRGAVDDPGRFELTPFGIRSASATNAVSRRHGEVARSMWHHLYPGRSVGDVPISHVTNGVHAATWMAPSVQEMLSRHLGPGWQDRGGDPDAWAAVDAIPDEELWSIRTRLRGNLADALRSHGIELDRDVLTLGFARRVAAYKRLGLLMHDAERLRSMPLQLVIAGKAHPADDDAKHLLRSVVSSARQPGSRARIAFVPNHDLGVATSLVTGCDVWVNLPTPPLEASGTSGMKAAMNGGLNLSVLDGWWSEAYDGSNGWAIESDPDADPDERNAADAEALYSLLEDEVIPTFAARNEAGIPSAWVERVRRALRTVGPRFSAARMLGDYVGFLYRTG